MSLFRICLVMVVIYDVLVVLATPVTIIWMIWALDPQDRALQDDIGSTIIVAGATGVALTFALFVWHDRFEGGRR